MEGYGCSYLIAKLELLYGKPKIQEQRKDEKLRRGKIQNV